MTQIIGSRKMTRAKTPIAGKGKSSDRPISFKSRFGAAQYQQNSEQRSRPDIKPKKKMKRINPLYSFAKKNFKKK